MLVSRRQHINPDNWMVHTDIWKNVVPVICDTLCTTQLNTSAIGIQPLQPISPRNEQKANIIMLPFHMLSKNWYESFIILKNRISNTAK